MTITKLCAPKNGGDLFHGFALGPRGEEYLFWTYPGDDKPAVFRKHSEAFYQIDSAPNRLAAAIQMAVARHLH